jgi:hypothetical protein
MSRKEGTQALSLLSLTPMLKRPGYPASLTARRHRYNLKQNYNLTDGEYETLLTQQGGVCAICQESAVQLTVDQSPPPGG